MSNNYTYFKLFSHMLLAFVIMLTHTVVTEAVAQETPTEVPSDSGENEYSAEALKNIENAKINKQIADSPNIISPPSCSNVADIKNKVNEAAGEFNTAYRNQYDRALFDLRRDLDRAVGNLGGTYSFVKPPTTGADPATMERIAEEEKKLEPLLIILDEKETALQNCLSSTPPGPLACNAERQARNTARNNALNQAKVVDQVAAAGVYEVDKAAGEGRTASGIQDKHQKMVEARNAYTQYEQILADAQDAFNNCTGSCTAEQQALDDAGIGRDIAYNRMLQAQAEFVNGGNTARTGLSDAEASDAKMQESNQKAEDIERMYQRYINSIDDYVSYAESIQEKAIRDYKNAETINANNSDYDVFSAIMGDFDSQSDQILNQKILLKSLAMSGTASSGVNSLECIEVEEAYIDGQLDRTGPMLCANPDYHAAQSCMQGSKAVEVSSYKLFKAASAIYLTAQINSASVNNEALDNCILKCEPLVDIDTYNPTRSIKDQIVEKMGAYHMPECSYRYNGNNYPGYFSNDRNANDDKNEQIAAVERAANLYQKLVEVTELKKANMEKALEVYTAAWQAALEEWNDKNTRVNTVLAEIAQVEAMIDETENNIMLIIIALIAATAWAISCSSPCTCCGPAWALVAALAAYLLFLQDEKSAYEAELAKWEKELERAQTHAMLACNFPGYDVNYNQWNKSKGTNATLPSSIQLGRKTAFSSVTPPADDGKWNFMEALNQKVADTKLAPSCDLIDLKLAKSFFKNSGNEIMNFFISSAMAQIDDSDTKTGDALGLRGKEDIADKSQGPGGNSNTNMFKIFLAQKLNALRIQTYSPLDAGLVDLRDNPVSVTGLSPQNVEELGGWLYGLNGSNGDGLQSSNAMSYSPSGNSRPTNTGFPLVETRHFYIQSVIWQLQDLINELNNALGRNCGVIGPAAIKYNMSQSPENLCDQRDFYVTLLNQMRNKMELGITGLDNGIAKDQVKSGVCMKEVNGAVVLDQACECKLSNTCADWSFPSFNGIAADTRTNARLTVEQANALSRGDTEAANIAAGNLSTNSKAINKRAKKLNDLFQESQNANNNSGSKKSLASASNNRFGLNANRTTNGSNLNGSGSSNSSNGPKTIISGLAEDKEKKEKESNEKTGVALELASTSSGAGTTEKKGQPTKKRKEGPTMDFNFGEGGLDFGGSAISEAQKLKTLKKLQRKESEKQAAVQASFQKFNQSSYNKSRNIYEGTGIHENSSRSLWKILTKRYKKTAYPVLLDVGERR